MIGLAPNLARAARLRFEPITATVTGLRISAFDGTAFIDNLPANILAKCDGNHQITIRDAGNLELAGVLKAQGVSETVGSELNHDFGFADISLWVNTNWSFNGGVATHTPGSNISLRPASGSGFVGLTLNMLYFSSFTVESISTGSIGTRIGLGNVIERTVAGNYSQYDTGVADLIWRTLAPSSNTDAACSSVSLKQVTAPSATGATIVSTKAGTTYNFASLNASFVYNAASYAVTVQRI